MFCPHCGSEAIAGATFCGACGRRLPEAPPPTPSPITTAGPLARRSIVPAGALAALAVLAIGVVGVGGLRLTADDPATAAREVTKAALEMDEPTTRDLTCEAEKRQSQGLLAVGLATSLFAGPTIGVSLGGADQLTFKTARLSGDDAEVMISGDRKSVV